MTTDDLGYPEGYGTSTAGWSGSDASHQRAMGEAANGVARYRQSRVLGLLTVLGKEGITVAELRDMEDLHHGQASSALSGLHKKDRLVRLKDQRDRCHVYVLPSDTDGREAQSYGRRTTTTTTEPVQTLNSDDKVTINRVERLIADRGEGVWMLYPTAAVKRLVEIAKGDRG